MKKLLKICGALKEMAKGSLLSRLAFNLMSLFSRVLTGIPIRICFSLKLFWLLINQLKFSFLMEVYLKGLRIFLMLKVLRL